MSSAQPARRLDSPRLVAQVNARTGADLRPGGASEHGELKGVGYVSCPDGREAGLTRSPLLPGRHSCRQRAQLANIIDTALPGQTPFRKPSACGTSTVGSGGAEGESVALDTPQSDVLPSHVAPTGGAHPASVLRAEGELALGTMPQVRAEASGPSVFSSVQEAPVAAGDSPPDSISAGVPRSRLR